MEAAADAAIVVRRSGRLAAWLRSPVAWIGLAAFAGVVCRILLARAVYPVGGDPVYSYAYRALLIANGDWRGVTLMWHPPGYPLLLAAFTWVAGGMLSPYAWGVALGSAGAVVLIVLVDTLVAPRVRWPLTRLIAASFVALYEGLLFIASAPLTEALYLPAIFGAIVILDRARRTMRAPVLAGALAGTAATMRLEGAAVAGGLAVYLLACDWRSRARWRATLLYGAGFLIAAGWLLPHDEYLARLLVAHREGYTVAAASSLAGQISRVAEVAYVASVTWLPHVVLLPYWFFIAWGLPARGEAGRRLNWLLLSALLPNLLVVMPTVMHKRTGSFLLPAVAVWTAFGAERMVAELGLAERRRWRRVLLGAVIALNVAQTFRVVYRPERSDSVTHVQGSSLVGAAPGCVWAFGGEPEVYYFAGFPVHYPFYDRDRQYNAIYRDRAGDPAAFVRALREASFSYLTFTLPAAPAAAAAGAPQPYERYSGRARFDDLASLAADPARHGLEEVSAATVGAERVYVYRLASGGVPSNGPRDGAFRCENSPAR